MAILKIGTARMEVAGGSTEEDEANVDEWGDGKGGKDKKIGVEILPRHPLEQLQSASPAAASCSGWEKNDENVEKKAAGEAGARGRMQQPIPGGAPRWCGDLQLQEHTAAAEGRDEVRRRNEEQRVEAAAHTEDGTGPGRDEAAAGSCGSCRDGHGRSAEEDMKATEMTAMERALQHTFSLSFCLPPYSLPLCLSLSLSLRVSV